MAKDLGISNVIIRNVTAVTLSASENEPTNWLDVTLHPDFDLHSNANSRSLRLSLAYGAQDNRLALLQGIRDSAQAAMDKLVPPEDVPETVERPTARYRLKKDVSVTVAAVRMRHDFTLVHCAGSDVAGKAGDWLLTRLEGPDDQWRIPAEKFKELYELVPEEEDETDMPGVLQGIEDLHEVLQIVETFASGRWRSAPLKAALAYLRDNVPGADEEEADGCSEEGNSCTA